VNTPHLEPTGGRRLTAHFPPHSPNPLMPAHGRMLLLARALYIVLLFGLLGLFVAGIPVQLQSFSAGSTGVYVTYNSGGEPELSPLSGSPAGEAGIREGDTLLAIDGLPVGRWTQRDSIAKRLGGPVGTDTVVEVRTPEGQVHQYAVRRDVRGLREVGLPVGAYALFRTTLDALLLLGFGIPALIILARKSHDWFGMYVSLLLVVVALVNTSEHITLAASVDAGPEGRAVLMGFNFLYKTLTILLFCVFPNGQFVPRWTRLLAVAGLVWACLLLLPLPYSPWVWPFALGNLSDMSFYLLGLYAQAYRYRYVSTPQERQQTKWVLFGLTFTLVAIYAYGLPLLYVPALQVDTAMAIRYQLIGRPLYLLGLLVAPAAFMISILRYRLWDIDLVVNRTLVYGTLTVALALIYSGSIIVLQRLFGAFIRQESDLAAVSSTLVIAALFTPLRAWIQQQIDRRFYRTRYDAQETLAAFKARLRDGTTADLDELTGNLLQVIEETIHPLHVSIWLRPGASSRDNTPHDPPEVRVIRN
jgi:hypothetical protein